MVALCKLIESHLRKLTHGLIDYKYFKFHYHILHIIGGGEFINICKNLSKTILLEGPDLETYTFVVFSTNLT